MSAPLNAIALALVACTCEPKVLVKGHTSNDCPVGKALGDTPKLRAESAARYEDEERPHREAYLKQHGTMDGYEAAKARQTLFGCALLLAIPAAGVAIFLMLQ